MPKKIAKNETPSVKKEKMDKSEVSNAAPKKQRGRPRKNG